MTELNESQIDLMNAYVRKQEEFTIELMRRFLETQSKLDLSDITAKTNAGMITDLMQNSAKTVEELERKHANEKHSAKSRIEVLERDYKVLENNYDLTKRELNKTILQLNSLTDIEKKYHEIANKFVSMETEYYKIEKKLESLQKLNTKKVKTVETKKESGTSNGPLE